MKTIWKYAIAIKDDVEIVIPKNAVILTVQIQKGVPCIWVEVEPENKTEIRKFKWIGTGHKVPDGDKKYIGTIMVLNDNLVFHLYENLKR